MKHLFQITTEDIKKGRTGSCSGCPIALSAKRHFPTLVCEVTSDELYFALPGGGTAGKYFRLPHAAELFIWAFDRQKPVEPFDFEMEINLPWEPSNELPA